MKLRLKPTERRIDVFVSSTSNDLTDHRQKIRDVITNRKLHPIMMEDFPAISQDAVDLCKGKVEEAELFIGVYANRYGYRPNNGEKSITELEYEWAKAKGIDRLLFVLDKNYTWPDDHPINKYADSDPRLATFLGNVGKELVWKTYTTPEDLQYKVNLAVETWQRRDQIWGRVRLFAILVAFVLVVAIVGVVVNAALNPPVELVNSPFNIAVAGFAVDAASGISASDAQRLSEQFYTNLKVRLDEINPELTKLGGAIGIWSPSQIGTVTGMTREERDKNAELLVKQLKETRNAEVHILVYGIITKEGDEVAVIPEFYNFHPSPELSEVRGRFDLATVLAVPGPNLLPTLTVQLSDRSEILALITQGLSLMTASAYDRAQSAYEQALTVGGSDLSGRELLYILVGNASTFNYNALAAGGGTRDLQRLPQLLTQAETAYKEAIALNPAYSRAYAGLGSIQYLRAVTGISDNQAWQSLDETVLNQIDATFDKSMASLDQPGSADIPTKVTFGKAQVALLRFLRDSRSNQPDAANQAWTQADDLFGKVITDYGDGANVRVKEFAAQAYGFKALLRKERAQFADATKLYTTAAELTDQEARRQLFKRSIVQIRADELRAAQDIDGALKAYDDLLTFKMTPSDRGATYFQKCKMLTEANRSAEALTCLEEAVQLDLQLNPTLAASLWVELGNHYYDDGRLADCITSYEKALALDPDGQAHLAALIEETKAEMGKVTATP
jgi:tetratricopeptide (TPR) repeat protein